MTFTPRDGSKEIGISWFSEKGNKKYDQKKKKTSVTTMVTSAVHPFVKYFYCAHKVQTV